MKRAVLILASILSLYQARSQQTRIFTDPLRQFWQARELFQKEEYSLAYPLFRELHENLRETDYANARLATEEVNFYTTVCALKQQEARAEDEARAFIGLERNDALQEKMAFHLGEYYFYREDLRNAIVYYEQADIAQLSNREIALMKFHQGYGYFSLGQFEKAKPLLNTIRQMPDNQYFADANYYFGFISYGEGRYADALDAFRKVENHPVYGQAVPFYIASILYQQGQKDKALQYAESKLGSSRALYDREFQQLAGHAYFEKRQFARALPLLEASLKGQAKITREQQYELSYCYYEGKQYTKAAEGFRLLTEGSDSLTQSAMYLLGDAYLKMGDKPNARTAFAYCASNSSIPAQREVSAFNYGKLSYELGYQDIALNELRRFIQDYPQSTYNKEARELLVALMANTNNYREAIELLEGLQQPSEAARQLYPRVAYGRAMELVNDERLDDAGRLLDKVLADPNNAPVLSQAQFWKGEIAYRQNKLDDAIRHFHSYLGGSAVTAGEINAPHARYNLGYAYLRKENYKVAEGFFTQVASTAKLNSPPVEQDAWLRAADCHFMTRDFSKANVMYAKAIDYSWPSADYALYQQAMIAGIAKPSEKIRILNSFERKYPGSELVPAVNMEIASTYLADEKYKEAIPYLQLVVKNTNNAGNLKPRAYLRLGIAQYNLNNNKAALDNYRTLVNDYPDAPETDEALESARAIFVEEGRTADYAEFLRAAGRTVTRNQEDSLSWSAVESRYAAGDMNASLSSINDYLKRFPDGEFHGDALFMRSEIYQSRKDWKNALEGYAALADKGQGKYLEKASHQAARISYFELKDYTSAEKYFTMSKSVTGNREQRLDAMRGLLRSQYQLKKWKEAESNAEELLREKSISTDDKVLASMVRGMSAQSSGKYSEAIQHYRSVLSLNNAAYAAEARYSIAFCYFSLNDLKNAERAAFETINKSGSYDYWITKAYILLGDVFWKQKDYFNAKATLQSVVENSRITELKEEAQVKLELVTEEEKKQTPIQDK
jgi:TolA-binding protein